MVAAQVVKRGRGHPRAYLLPSPVGKATDPEETFRPAVCPRSKVSPSRNQKLWHHPARGILTDRLSHDILSAGPYATFTSCLIVVRRIGKLTRHQQA